MLHITPKRFVHLNANADLLSQPPTAHAVHAVNVCYRAVCGATACTDAAATPSPGCRSPESWREEQQPTPPPPILLPHLRSDTALSCPCRGCTWSRHARTRWLCDLKAASSPESRRRCNQTSCGPQTLPVPPRLGLEHSGSCSEKNSLYWNKHVTHKSKKWATWFHCVDFVYKREALSTYFVSVNTHRALLLYKYVYAICGRRCSIVER